nr:uncharacterized protein LOC131278346 [Dasypus novemcinctus]
MELGIPDPNCLETLQEIYSSQQDHQDQPLPNPDMEFFMDGENMNAVSHYHKLCSRVSYIWGNRRGQHIQRVMDKAHPGKTTFEIMVSPCQTPEVCALPDSSWRRAEAEPPAGDAGECSALGCTSQAAEPAPQPELPIMSRRCSLLERPWGLATGCCFREREELIQGKESPEAEEGARRAPGEGVPGGAPSPRWPRACLFKRFGGARGGRRRARFHGARAAGAAGAAGQGHSFRSSRSRRSRGEQSGGRGASGARGAAPGALRAPATAVRAEGPARPPPGDAARRPPSPAHQLLPREPNLCARLGLVEPARRAACRPGGGRSHTEMTSQLWLWCVCSWVAAGGPPGSALQLAPGMPNVCEEQQLAVVRLARPCVQAFTHTVKLWKQGCTGLRWCVAYERRTKYYSVHRQAYSTERQTVYKCCPGWSQRYAEQAACTPFQQWGLISMGRDAQMVKPSGASVQRDFMGPAVNMI